MKLLWSELYKLVHDIQLRICVFVLLFYSIMGFSTSVNQDLFQGATVSEFLEYNFDPAILLIFSSFICPAVFAAEYSYRSYKNMVPFFSRSKIYLIKMLTMMIGFVFILVLDMLICSIFASLMTGDMLQLADMRNILFRYCTFFAMIMLLTSLLTLFSMIVRNRALTYIATVAFALMLVLLPIPFGDDGIKLWDLWQTSYAWGSVPNGQTIFFTIAASAFLFFVGGIVFYRREIKP